MEPIDRCAAINVNPKTGERDINLVKSLQGGFGHINMGVLAKVTKAGYFVIGDVLGF
jgi:uncharacterized protein YcbX